MRYNVSDGARLYRAMCDRQAALCNLAQLGGPTKLTMPAHSTVSKMINYCISVNKILNG